MRCETLDFQNFKVFSNLEGFWLKYEIHAMTQSHGMNLATLNQFASATLTFTFFNFSLLILEMVFLARSRLTAT